MPILRGNQWVKTLAQDYFNSTTGNVRTETFRSSSNNQSYNNFDITLLKPLQRGDVTEVSLLNLSTNWLPQSNLLQKDYTTEAVIVTFGAFYTYQGFPFYNYSPNTTTFAGNTTNVDLNNGILTLCAGGFSAGTPTTFLPVQPSLTVPLTFYAGQNLSNQYLTLQSIGNQLSQAINNNINYSFNELYNNFSNAPFMIEFLNIGSYKNQGMKWTQIVTESEWNINIGQIESSNGFLGFKASGFQPLIALAFQGDFNSYTNP